MGSSGSFEDSNSLHALHPFNSAQTDRGRIYCHSCRTFFQNFNELVNYNPENVEDISSSLCANCNSSFLEDLGTEFEGLREPFAPPRSMRTFLFTINNPSSTGSVLTAEQNFRFHNSITILNLLEMRMRQELESLQQNLEEQQSILNEKNSAICCIKLNDKKDITTDDLQSQPLCPICSEDFILGECQTQLPCDHLYHKNCIASWMKVQQKCPICRYEICKNLPVVTDFENHSIADLREKVQSLDMNTDIEGKSKYDLALHIENYFAETKSVDNTNQISSLENSSTLPSNIAEGSSEDIADVENEIERPTSSSQLRALPNSEDLD